MTTPTDTDPVPPTPSDAPTPAALSTATPQDDWPAPPPRRGLLLKLSERPRWLGVFLLSIIVFAVSAAAMIGRIDSYNQSDTRPAAFAFQQITAPTFTYAGLPVAFEHVPSAVGAGFVRVTFGQSELMMPVRVEGIDELPDLRRYENWMKVLRFFETTGMSVAEAQARLDAGEIADRLAIAVRIPPAGADTATWGTIRRGDWRFELHEFIPPPTQSTGETPPPSFASESFVTPESERSFNRRVARASQQGEPIPNRRDDELKQGTWQHDAAQLTMPDKRGFTPVFGADAFEAFGWTFPAAGVAAFGLAVSLAFLLAPRREEVEAR